MTEHKNRQTKDTYSPKEVGKDLEKIHSSEIALSDTDRIMYIYQRNANQIVSEVTNVSYEIKINDHWITIVRYDSSHGYLHRHLVISLTNPSDTPTEVGVKKKGSHPNWLTWAVEDIKKHYVGYKRGFLRRSNIPTIDKE